METGLTASGLANVQGPVAYWQAGGALMSDRDLATLFREFDRGRLSRRQLLTALGLAVAVRPAAAFAQSRCTGDRANSPDCNTTPGKLPFEATGWRTVLLDHLT